MKKRELKIFVDFDGTITQQDVGDSIFSRFGDPKKVNSVIDDLLNDRISSRECWDLLCSSTPAIKKKDLDAFIDNLVIDSTFHSLVTYCKKMNIEMIVLSDGFDYYIKRILNRENLNDLKFHANNLKIDENGKLIPQYPYYNPDFPTSANCKRDHILDNSSDDDYTFYIGDGNSDKESAQFCDYIFAKDGLLKFCEKERISFSPFKDFNDVIKKIDFLISKRKLRKGHQAELKRRSAYLVE
ncbi:MAG TPA: MtnX-like HAD-IB family phosphatase [Ignavibacteriaceae bacterium]|nr:MtnX-like HAD-IB family phosphatase [Ignavibacteriaceae bacterium]